MLCPRCNSPLDHAAGRFCPFCGASLPRESPGSPAVEALAVVAPCPRHPAQKATELCDRCGSFACPLCARRTPEGRVLCADCFAREDAAGWAVPWERRGELGLLRAYWETAKAVLFSPNESLGRLSPSMDRWWDPLSFAVVSSFIAFSGLALFYAGIFGLGLLGVVAGRGVGGLGGLGATVFGGGLAAIVAMVLMTLVGTVVGAFVIGGLDHLMLMLLGAQPRGFQATMRVYCYAHAPMIFGLVPVCGAYAYPVWLLVCRILGYRGAHRTSGGKATAAVLLPTGFCCAGGAALYAAALVASLSR